MNHRNFSIIGIIVFAFICIVSETVEKYTNLIYPPFLEYVTFQDIIVSITTWNIGTESYQR